VGQHGQSLKQQVSPKMAERAASVK
jgi:hypothetical protein